MNIWRIETDFPLKEPHNSLSLCVQNITASGRISEVQCITVQYSVVQYSKVQHSLVHCSPVQSITVQTEHIVPWLHANPSLSCSSLHLSLDVLHITVESIFAFTVISLIICFISFINLEKGVGGNYSQLGSFMIDLLILYRSARPV